VSDITPERLAEITADRDAALSKIAAIAHDGGLLGNNGSSALTSIRRLSVPYWDKTGTEQDRAIRARAALHPEANS
jgi:hypothetical protein